MKATASFENKNGNSNAINLYNEVEAIISNKEADAKIIINLLKGLVVKDKDLKSDAAFDAIIKTFSS